MKKYRVHIEDNDSSNPRPHEKQSAEIIAELFQSDVIFMRRFQSKTPDLYILKTNVRWELKSPIGGSKHTIQNNLRDASSQSENIILDLSRAKITDMQGISRSKEFLKKEKSHIKRLKILTKDKQLIDIR